MRCAGEREDLDTWLDFAALCRRGGNLALSQRVLKMSSTLRCPACDGRGAEHEHCIIQDLYLSPPFEPESAAVEKKVRFAVLRQLWSVGHKVHAVFEVVLQYSDLLIYI